MTPDWNQLRTLRSIYLQNSGIRTPWSAENLEAYDQTFGRRILWKWQWVLKTLKQVNPSFGSNVRLLDYGCGTGVAAEAFLLSDFAKEAKSAHLYDRTNLAIQFSQKKLQSAFPQIAIEPYSNSSSTGLPSLILLSHLLNELNESDLRVILAEIKKADSFIWVEPGTHETSRRLVMIRESLKSEFTPIAPCPHSNSCGLLTPQNEKHWCHFFADVPSQAFTESFWSRFSKELSIDMRSLPVSYLVMSKGALRFGRPAQRILGRPRLYKGYGMFLTCTASGVSDNKVLKRNAPELFR